MTGSLRRTFEVVMLIVGGGGLVLMMLLISLDVALRSIIKVGLPLTPEIVSMYLMVLVCFAPTALAEIYRRHIVATVLVDVFPPSVRSGLVVVADVASLAVYALLAYRTALEAIRRTEARSYIESGSILFATWPGYWVLPFAFSCMAAVLFLRSLSGLRRGYGAESWGGAS